MNGETQKFIEELKKRDDVLGVILFGSWARGDNRPDSDVDLVVVLNEGTKRAIESRGDQVFEIVYVTEKDASDFWEAHRDDAADLWAVAKVVYDKDGTIERLKNKTKAMLAEGKLRLDEAQKVHFRFDAEDQLRYVEAVMEKDPATAQLVLTNKIFALTGLFFDLRKLWTPAPKRRLAKIKELESELYLLLAEFYAQPVSLGEKLEIAKKIVSVIFGR